MGTSTTQAATVGEEQCERESTSTGVTLNSGDQRRLEERKYYLKWVYAKRLHFEKFAGNPEGQEGK